MLFANSMVRLLTYRWNGSLKFMGSRCRPDTLCGHT